MNRTTAAKVASQGRYCRPAGTEHRVPGIVFLHVVCCALLAVRGPAQLAQGAEAPVPQVPVVAARPADGKPHYKLEYKLQAGQTLYYDIAQTAKFTTQKNETAETAHNESTTRMNLRVLSVAADGTAELESRIDHVKMSYHFGDGKPITFDSRSDPVPPRAFASIPDSLGKPLARLKVEKSGRLVSAVSLRGDKAKDAMDDPARNFLTAFPPAPVAVGDHWTEQFTVKVQITKNLTNKVNLLRKFELVSVEKNIATIHVAIDVLTPVNDPQILAQLIQRTPQGTIQLDLGRGLIVSRVMKTDKTEIGVLGPKSSVRAQSELTETLVSPPAVAVMPSPSDPSQATTPQ